MRKLRDVSTSGVYETIKIGEVVEAYTRKGIFHDMIEMHLTLKSDHFADPAENEKTHQVIVLKSRSEAGGDGIESVALDDFPLMKPESIESYKKTKFAKEKRRRSRLLKELAKGGRSPMKIVDDFYASDKNQQPV